MTIEDIRAAVRQRDFSPSGKLFRGREPGGSIEGAEGDAAFSEDIDDG